jgi:hypothetical protein
MPLDTLAGKVEKNRDLISVWVKRWRFEPLSEEKNYDADDGLRFQPCNDRRSQPGAERKLPLAGWLSRALGCATGPARRVTLPPAAGKRIGRVVWWCTEDTLRQL